MSKEPTTQEIKDNSVYIYSYINYKVSISCFKKKVIKFHASILLPTACGNCFQFLQRANLELERASGPTHVALSLLLSFEQARKEKNKIYSEMGFGPNMI